MPEAFTNIAPKKRGRPPKGTVPLNKQSNNPLVKARKIDVGQALKMRLKGNTLQEIGNQFNCSKEAVYQAITPILNSILPKDQLDTYKSKQDDILTSAQMTLLSAALNPASVKKQSTSANIMSYAVLFDKQRLLQDKSTSNVSIRSVTAHLDTMRQDLEKQIAELSSAQDVVNSI